MTENNYERMKIVLSMDQPFDYADFVQRCGDKGLVPLSVNAFAMKVGFIQMAKIKYPDIPIEAGYMNIINDSNAVVYQAKPTGCGTCGGGAVV